MKAKVIFYQQDNLSQNNKFKLRRELLGLEQKSNFSRYKYKVKGLLDETPHYRPVNSTIIIRNKDLGKIKAVLDKHDAKSEIFDIDIPKSLFLK